MDANLSDIEIVSALFLKKFLLSLFHTHSDILLEFLGLQRVSYAKLMKRTYTYWQARFSTVVSLPIYLASNSRHHISGSGRQEDAQPSSHRYGESASPPPESYPAPKHQNLLSESQHNSYFLFTLENLDNKVHRAVFKHKVSRDHRCR